MNTPQTPEAARINKLAMDLIGDLQLIPPDQAYERIKQALNEAAQSPTLLSQRNELRVALATIAEYADIPDVNDIVFRSQAEHIARAALASTGEGL